MSKTPKCTRRKVVGLTVPSLIVSLDRCSFIERRAQLLWRVSPGRSVRRVNEARERSRLIRAECQVAPEWIVAILAGHCRISRSPELLADSIPIRWA